MKGLGEEKNHLLVLVVSNKARFSKVAGSFAETAVCPAPSAPSAAASLLTQYHWADHA